MAKKLVRGITNVKTINNQDFDTNNVNDLLSDGEYNYIHRKKGKSEEYHNLTDNIKTISSSDTNLIEVTNNNTTSNTATLKPKHDAQKEQVLASQNNTITIQHGTNGTNETTKVNTNPQKVLEHENLISDSEYITITHKSSETSSHIQTAKLKEELNDLQANKQDLLVAGNGITIQDNTISATNSTSQVIEQVDFGTRGQGYYAFREAYGQRTTYTIEVVHGQAEFTVHGPLKTMLSSDLSTVRTITNGAITLTYDGTNVKIINNNPTLETTQQATFSFYTVIENG